MNHHITIVTWSNDHQLVQWVESHILFVPLGKKHKRNNLFKEMRKTCDVSSIEFMCTSIIRDTKINIFA